MSLKTISSVEKCRTCMGLKSNKVSVFQHEVSVRLMELANVQIEENDGLPSTICDDCETDLERCFKFKAQVQWADRMFRENTSQFQELERPLECFIKQEHIDIVMEEECNNSDSDHDAGDNAAGSSINNEEMENDDDDDDHDDDNVNTEPLNAPSTSINSEEMDNDDDDHVEHTNPLNHVDIVEDIRKVNKIEMAEDPLGQDEPLIEEHLEDTHRTELDPLNCIKEEAVSMETSNISADISSPSSSVRGTVSAMPFPSWPAVYNTAEDNFGMKNVQQNQSTQLLIVPASPDNFEKVNEYNNILSCSPNSSVSSTNTNNMNLIPTSSMQKISKPFEPYLFEFQNSSLQNACLPGNAPKLLKNSKGKPNTKLNSSTTETRIESDNKRKKENLKNADIWEVKNKMKSESVCLICNIDFLNAECLKDHMGRKVFHCRVCTRETETHAELETHFLNHTAHKCKVCEEAFLSLSDVFQHRKTSGACSNRVECEICNKTVLKKNLTRHTKWEHSGENSKKWEHSGENSIFKCAICPSTFNHSTKLKMHLRAVHVPYEDIQCRICKRQFLGPRKIQDHLKRYHLDPKENLNFTCSVCKKQFLSSRSLATHIDVHDETLQICNICGNSYKGKHALKLHMEKDHSKTGLFTCKYCNEQFDVLRKLILHKNHRHKKKTEKSPVYCEICGKKYKTLRILWDHKNTHSDKKPFKCEICGAAFKQKVALSTHMRVHSSVGKYRCEKCGESFKWKQTFDKHVIKCDVAAVEEDIDGDVEDREQSTT